MNYKNSHLLISVVLVCLCAALSDICILKASEGELYALISLGALNAIVTNHKMPSAFFNLHSIVHIALPI